MRKRISGLLLFAFFIGFSLNLYSQEKPDTRYWIVFVDKGEFKETDKILPGTKAYETGKEQITARAIQRRLKVLSEDNLIDFGDLPLNEVYVKKIQSMGIGIIAKSRWLNGVSANLSKEQMEKVKSLDFVKYLRVIDKLYKQDIVPVRTDYSSIPFINIINNEKTRYDYGKSYGQMNQIRVPLIHNMGINGKGVMIASFDSGFEWRDHEALRDLNITDEFDAINKDNATYNEANQKYKDVPDQSEHGTATLSNMAGFKEGKLIGPAFGSEIILAKTEYGPTETPMEEDFYLEAAEWAEAKGTDIITSSLGYRIFDKPFDANSYKWEHFNGKNAITSIAGKRAAYLGVVVISSNGNYMQTNPPSVGSPAEGDSIIGVGAVDIKGNIASFSSNGPTSDGRIKPDVCALGVSNFVAVSKQISGVDNAYSYSNGTSFSCPIVAGVAALILSAHPELTPMQVRDALRNTASNSENPNNVYGWGIIDAYNAMLYWGMVWGPEVKLEKVENGYKVSVWLASNNPIDLSSVNVSYNAGSAGMLSEDLKLVEPNGDGNNSGRYEAILKIDDPDKLVYTFSARDSKGNEKIFTNTN